MKFDIIHDGEFVETYETLAEAIQHVRTWRQDFEEDKLNNPQWYQEDDEFDTSYTKIYQEVDIDWAQEL